MVVWSEDEDVAVGAAARGRGAVLSFWSQQDDAPGDPHRAVGEGGDDAVVTSAGPRRRGSILIRSFRRVARQVNRRDMPSTRARSSRRGCRAGTRAGLDGEGGGEADGEGGGEADGASVEPEDLEMMRALEKIGWRREVDELTGGACFVHLRTGDVTWRRPNGAPEHRCRKERRSSRRHRRGRLSSRRPAGDARDEGPPARARVEWPQMKVRARLRARRRKISSPHAPSALRRSSRHHRALLQAGRLLLANVGAASANISGWCRRDRPTARQRRRRGRAVAPASPRRRASASPRREAAALARASPGARGSTPRSGARV